jgi:error-prone DNA polymerase
MAAWRRKGGLEHFHGRLIDGMLERGYPRQFAERIFQQILGFGEYGFPESHSVSFALLAYVSAWLKHHEPAAFLAAMLNAQPLGFYSPSQLVQDARRHGIEVRPVDVTASDWECTLEVPSAGHESRVPSPESRLLSPAVRLGFLMVKGLSQDGTGRIVTARGEAPLASVEDLARRTGLNQRDLKSLAAAGALAALAGHRRTAHWQVAGVEIPPRLLREAPIREAEPRLAAPTEGENLIADYGSLGLTLGRHPLALLRGHLKRMRLVTASELHRLANGRPARTAGIVTCRQRPSTAKGVVFVTLEDETGYVNVVVWRDLVERQRRELLGSSLLGVEGEIQREGEVVHLVARRLTDHTQLLGRLVASSRDFH